MLIFGRMVKWQHPRWDKKLSTAPKARVADQGARQFSGLLRTLFATSLLGHNASGLDGSWTSLVFSLFLCVLRCNCQDVVSGPPVRILAPTRFPAAWILLAFVLRVVRKSWFGPQLPFPSFSLSIRRTRFSLPTNMYTKPVVFPCGPFKPR